MEQSPSIATEPAASSREALDYAPRPRAHRHRWLRRMVLAGMLIALLLISARWGRSAWTRAAFLYHQRACMNYTAPPDQVVFDSNPARVAALVKDPNFVIYRGCAFRRLPSGWQAITAAFARPSPHAIVFLHERHVAAGSLSLVSLERTAAADESALFVDGYDVDPIVLQPATLNQPLRGISGPSGDLDVLDGWGPHTDIRIYAGQPDPADASHFTIRFEMGGAIHTVDGYLNVGGRVTMKWRHEAADGPN